MSNLLHLPCHCNIIPLYISTHKRRRRNISKQTQGKELLEDKFNVVLKFIGISFTLYIKWEETKMSILQKNICNFGLGSFIPTPLHNLLALTSEVVTKGTLLLRFIRELLKIRTNNDRFYPS